MFCSVCGEELNKPNQRFCQNCGTENVATANINNYKTQRIQNVAPPKIYYEPRQQQRKAQIQGQVHMGRAGKYSKKSLVLALASFIIGLVSLVAGYNYYRISYSPYSNFTVGLVVVIVILVVRVGGLILGIFAKVDSSRAEISEPYNDAQKAGSILGLIGIIINGIGLFLSLMGPFSIFNIPFFYYYY